MPSSIDVVIPAYNEAATLGPLLDRLRLAVPSARLIVVDNASTDSTPELAASHPGTTLLRHETNLGYGRSLADGIAAGTGERIVMIDADLEYAPEDVPVLLAALDAAPAVFGSRFLDPSRREAGRSIVWRMGNRMVTTSFNVLFDQRLTDLYTGIRGVRRSALDGMCIESPGFEFVLELAARLARRGLRIAEVPCSYAPRTTGTSQMRHLPELLRFVRRLVALRFEPGCS